MYGTLCTYAYKIRETHILEHQVLDASLISSVTFLTTFVIGQYYSFVLGRYNGRFENVCKSNGHVTLVSVYCNSWCGLQRNITQTCRLLRFTNLMYHLYHMQIFGTITDERWNTLRRRGLVTKAERATLSTLRKAGTRICAWCDAIVDDLRISGEISEWQASRLHEHIGGARGLAAKQIAFQLTGVPFPFLHALTVNITLLLLMMMWNSAIRMMDALMTHGCPLGHGGHSAHPSEAELMAHVKAGHCNNGHAVTLEVTGMLLVVILFKAVWHSALDLSDPYGDDVCDYDIDNDLQGLWVESLEQIAELTTKGNLEGVEQEGEEQAVEGVRKVEATALASGSAAKELI